MKKCIKCNTLQSKSSFNKKKTTSDGLQVYCRECDIEYKKIYNRTKNGLINIIYNHQVQSSKRRNHEKPLYSKKELIIWTIEQSSFELLYEEWIKDNYSKNKKPSIDRLNDYKPYSIDNIRLTTWEENNKKGNDDRRHGINNKVNKKVNQYDLQMNFIKSFHSIAEASRQTNILISNISRCCLGERPTAGKFKWEIV